MGEKKVGNPRILMKVMIRAVCALFMVAFVIWIAGMRDPATNYSDQNIERLKTKINEEKAEIARFGNGAASLDSDRWRPYDRDRTALGMFKYHTMNKRWPNNWKELLDSKLLDDPSCIHNSWELKILNTGWEIHWVDSPNGRRTKIAFYNEKG